MKIGIDLCDLNPDFAGGVNTFAFGIIRGLIDIRESGDRITLLVTDNNEAFLRTIFAESDVSFLDTPVGLWREIIDSLLFKLSWAIGNFRIRYWYDRIFRAELMRDIDNAVDVLIAPMTLLKWYGMRAPVLLSIHDIQQEYLPELFSWKDRVRRWTPYRLSAWRAEAIQASSRYIKDCLIEKFSFVQPERIVVIPEGVDRDKFSMNASSEKPSELDPASGDFVFYPAQIWAHKNHLLLIDALALYRDIMGSEFPCVLTGRDYGCWPTVRAKIEAHGLRNVHFLGQVSFPQLLWIYQNCRAVLALGLHESSSLPLREGAVLGKVLIGLDIPPNREAQENFYIQLVDPTNPQDLAAVFVALSEDHGALAEMSRQNTQRAAHFDWKNIVREYRQILGQLIQTDLTA